MDSLRRGWERLQDHPWVISFALTIATVILLFQMNVNARNERTLELCYSSISDSEKLILVSAQNPEPDDPSQEGLLRLFRQLTKDSLPDICRPQYERLRREAVRQLEARLKVALRAG